MRKTSTTNKPTKSKFPKPGTPEYRRLIAQMTAQASQKATTILKVKPWRKFPESRMGNNLRSE